MLPDSQEELLTENISSEQNVEDNAIATIQEVVKEDAFMEPIHEPTEEAAFEFVKQSTNEVAGEPIQETVQQNAEVLPDKYIQIGKDQELAKEDLKKGPQVNITPVTSEKNVDMVIEKTDDTFLNEYEPSGIIVNQVRSSCCPSLKICDKKCFYFCACRDFIVACHVQKLLCFFSLQLRKVKRKRRKEENELKLNKK